MIYNFSIWWASHHIVLSVACELAPVMDFELIEIDDLFIFLLAVWYKLIYDKTYDMNEFTECKLQTRFTSMSSFVCLGLLRFSFHIRDDSVQCKNYIHIEWIYYCIVRRNTLWSKYERTVFLYNFFFINNLIKMRKIAPFANVCCVLLLLYLLNIHLIIFFLSILHGLLRFIYSRTFYVLCCTIF